MALTITRDEYTVQGNKRICYGKLTFDASYVTGGMALVPRDLSFLSITRLVIDDPKGFAVSYDYTNQKLQAFYSSQFAIVSAQSSAAGVGNAADTTDDVLFTFNLPINALRSNGQALRVTAWGATAANGNNKRIRALLDAAILSSGVVTWNGQTWWLDAHFIRVDATHVNAVMSVSSSTATVNANALNQAVVNLGTTQAAVTVTGASSTTGAASDVVAHAIEGELLGVPGAAIGIEVPAGVDLSALTVNYMAEGI